LGQSKVVAALLCLLNLSSYAAPDHGQTTRHVIEDGMPIVFEPTPSRPVTMTGRLPGATVAFAPGMIQVELQGKQASQLTIGFAGALPAVPHGSSLAQSQSNYLLGNDPNLWRTHIPNYQQVVYTGLYPGIDAVFYGNGQLLEHDFVVAPGSDYRQIRLHLSEHAHATIANDGEMTIALSGGNLHMHKPVIYQDAPGGRQLREGGFHLLAEGDIGFTVESYDHRRPLVIDPVLTFSSYLSPLGDAYNYLATDSSGNNYLAGVAVLGFPVTPGAYAGCGTCTANENVAYVSKLSADGKTLVYSTLLGGNSLTQPSAISADANGNALVAGFTQATDFPTKNGQVVGTGNTLNFGFLTSLSPDGSSLNYSTMLGGTPPSALNTSTGVSALTLDAAGDAYVAGDSDSSLYPYTAGAVNNGTPTYLASQIFLTKFSPAGALIYSAFLGDPDPQNGGDGSTGPSAVAMDNAGDVFVAGQAGSLWPTTSGAYVRQIPGPQPYAAPFVTEVAAGGGSVLYSTYLDYAYQVTGIVAIPGGDVFVAATGAGPTYPTTPNAYQPSSNATTNSVLTELNATGTALVYSTFFGDTTYYLNALALDPDGDLWLAGLTKSPQFPMVTPLQDVLPLEAQHAQTGSTLSQFDPTGTILKFSTYLGGIAFGQATGVAVDANHRAHVAGAATARLYTTAGSYLETVPVPAADNYSLFPYVALVDPTVAAPALCVNPNTGLNWGQVTAGIFLDLKLTITNCGTQPLTVSSVSPAATVFTVPAAGNGCTQTLPVRQSCTLSVRYSPATAETDTSTLTIQSNASMTQTVLPLYGIGTVAKIQVSNPPTFGFTLVGQTSDPALLFLQNVGQSALILNPTNTRTSGDFSLQGLGNCSGQIPASQGCVLSIYFTPTAPGSRTGTLQIASNDPANPTVSVTLQGTGYTNAPVPQITSLGSQLLPAGVPQTSFTVQGFGFLPSSVVEVNGVPQQTTYVSDTALTATLAASSIPANSYGELAVTVVTPAPGGGQSAPYTLTEYQSVATQNTFLLYEPVGKQLYASIPVTSPTNPDTVLPINPVTAAPGTPIPVGENPGVLAASSDGAYLYVALNADHAIQRINLSTMAIERTFALPVDPTYGNNLQVADMQVVPGSPTEIAVSLEAPVVSPAANGVAFYNDAGLVNWIGRTGSVPNYNSTAADIYNFAFTNPGTLYGISGFQGVLNEFTVSPTGILTTHTTCCSAYNNLASDGSLIYTDAGLVWNPATGLQVGQYSLGTEPVMDSVIPDATSGKTYFLNTFGSYNQYQVLSVLAFDQTSLAQTASLSFAGFGQTSAPSGTQLVRWGSNGFALRSLVPPATDSGAILLFTSSITGGSNLNAAPVAGKLAPASTPAGGADFTLTVTGSNFVPGSTVEWNGSPRITTMVSATQLTATIYASDIATMGTAQVTVVNPGNGGGVSAALPFTISAALPPTPTVVTISPTTLTFATQAIATASAPQIISLKNSGSADLTGVKITITGAAAASFAETNNCGATVSAGTSCSVSVIFTPASAGALSATVNIADNATNSPQTIALSGTGTQTLFVIAPQSGGSATATVTAGQAATYALSLTPATGYSGTITLSCSGLPANANCSFTPATLAPAGSKAETFTVTIATEAPQTSELSGKLGAALAGVLLLLPWWKRRRVAACLVFSVFLFLTAGFSGCGGGSGSGTTTPTQPGSPSPATVAPGTYTVQLIASDGTTTQKMPLTLVVM
jgi:hypothetical protein